MNHDSVDLSWLQERMMSMPSDFPVPVRNPNDFRAAAEGMRPFSDLEWFAVDSAGHVGVFCSAGFGAIPLEIFVDEKSYLAAASYFFSLPMRCDFTLHGGSHYPVKTWYESAARRGLFSYDWDSSIAGYFRPDIPYRLIAAPAKPLTIEELPAEIAAWIEPIRFRTPFQEALYPQREFAYVNVPTANNRQTGK
jgi:hypothetical protein